MPTSNPGVLVGSVFFYRLDPVECYRAILSTIVFSRFLSSFSCIHFLFNFQCLFLSYSLLIFIFNCLLYSIALLFSLLLIFSPVQSSFIWHTKKHDWKKRNDLLFRFEFNEQNIKCLQQSTFTQRDQFPGTRTAFS